VRRAGSGGRLARRPDGEHDRLGELLRRGVGRQHVDHPERPQAPLGRLVPGRGQADDGDTGHREPGEGGAVEPAQVGREQDRAGRAGRGGGEQVGQVDAAAHHRDAEVAALEGDDELGLPDGVGHGREDGDRH
jgi:hypothetical protein